MAVEQKFLPIQNLPFLEVNIDSDGMELLGTFEVKDSIHFVIAGQNDKGKYVNSLNEALQGIELTSTRAFLVACNAYNINPAAPATEAILDHLIAEETRLGSKA